MASIFLIFVSSITFLKTVPFTIGILTTYTNK